MLFVLKFFVSSSTKKKIQLKIMYCLATNLMFTGKFIVSPSVNDEFELPRAKGESVVSPKNR